MSDGVGHFQVIEDRRGFLEWLVLDSCLPMLVIETLETRYNMSSLVSVSTHRTLRRLCRRAALTLF